MLDPLEKVTVGTTPSGLGKGMVGLMSGLLARAYSPTGVVRIALGEKLKPPSLTIALPKVLTAWKTTPRPGELVRVVAIFGTLERPNRPPASVVGMSSMVSRPQILKP